MKGKLLIILGFFVLGGCAASLPPLTPNQIGWASQRWPGADASTLEADRQLYRAKCSHCHSAVAPEKKSIYEWPHWLDKMTPKAKLSADERERIWRYLQAAKTNP